MRDVKLITNLSEAYTLQSKIDYLNYHYKGNDDILFGVVPDTKEGRALASKITSEFIEMNNEEWRKGAVIDGREIEFVHARIDHCQDFDMPDFLRQKPDSSWETITEMEKRMGQKCSGSHESFVTVAVCRRYVDPWNNIGIIEDEINGAIPVKIYPKDQDLETD